MHRWGPKQLGVVALGMGLLTSGAASAFTPLGHEIIEVEAYRELAETPAMGCGKDVDHPCIVSLGGAKVSGKDVLEALVARGALKQPLCTSAADRACGRDDFWPLPGSGQPDLLTARQFGSNGQCFHFMARSADVWDGPEDEEYGVPRRLIYTAYLRCTRALTATFRQLIADPREANDNFRGLYALIHAVTDSFSRAHVERDRENHIKYLKAWRLRSWLPFLVHWKGFKYFGDPRTHHDVFEERDNDYLRAEHEVTSAGGERFACSELGSPYNVPSECLSDDGRAAAHAVRDLLIAAYHGLTGKPEPAWHLFLERHMASARDENHPDVSAQRSSERDWAPGLLLGARYRARRIRADRIDEIGATVRVKSSGAAKLTLPFALFPAVESGCRLVEGHCVFVGGAELGVGLPITESLALGFTPVFFELPSVNGLRWDLGAKLARIDLFLGQTAWLGIDGVRYSWRKNRVAADDVSVTLGGAFDVSVDAGASPSADHWRPGRFPSWSDLGGFPNFSISASYVGSPLPDGGQWMAGGSGLVTFDRNRWNERRWWGIGLADGFKYRRRPTSEEYLLYLGLNFRFGLSWLGLHLMPMGWEPKWHRARESRAAGDENRYRGDYGAMAALLFQPLGHLTLTVETPLFSYRSLEFPWRLTQVGVGFSFGGVDDATL